MDSDDMDLAEARANAKIDDLLQAIQGSANFMRGMTMDPAIPGHVKAALANRIQELDDIVEGYHHG